VKPDIGSLIETLPCVVYRVNLPKVGIGFISRNVNDLCGYMPDELTSAKVKWESLVPEEDKSVILKFLEINPEESLFSAEYRIKHRDGSVRWVFHRAITKWDDGGPCWQDGIIVDITKQKRDQLELLARKNEVAGLVNSLDDIVFEVNSSGKVDYLHAKPGQWLSNSTSDWVNKTAIEIFNTLPGNSSVFLETYRETLLRKEELKIEYSFDDGETPRWYMARFLYQPISGGALITLKDVTKQKEGQLALAQSEWLFQQASEAAKIGAWTIDVQRRIVRWSNEIYRIREVQKANDLSIEEVIDYYPPQVRIHIKRLIDEGIKTGTPWDIELPIITGTGIKKWIRNIGVPEWENGKCKVVRGIYQDVTEKKNAEVALKRREQKLELAIRGVNLGTWSWEIVTGHISGDQRIAAMLGYPETELMSHISSWEELIHPDDKNYVLDGLQAHLRGEMEFYKVEYRLKHKQGNWVWILVNGKVIEQDGGKPIRVSGTFLDITDRKETEIENLQLQFELEEFKTAVNVATIVSITDKKGIIIYANHKFEEISKYCLPELIGNNHNLINSGHHPKSFWKEMWLTIGRGNVWRAEVKNKRKDGTFYWVDTVIIPLRNTENEITEFLSIRNDITQKKESEIELQYALERAQESDKLKAAFLANISHEVRTPMNAIMGFAELLERPHLPEKKRAQFSKLIYERSRNLLQIVNDILDVSKIEGGHISSVPTNGNIKELLDSLLSTFTVEVFHLKDQNILVKTVNELLSHQWIISADFLRLNQVFTNLLNNAVKFTGIGTIELGCKLLDSNQLLFWVRDTGMGIPSNQLEAIFRPFHQADLSIHQQYGGSGLGLAICKGLVELWNGTIWAESEVGRGSSFYFTMPFIQAGLK